MRVDYRSLYHSMDIHDFQNLIDPSAGQVPCFFQLSTRSHSTNIPEHMSKIVIAPL